MSYLLADQRVEARRSVRPPLSSRLRAALPLAWAALLLYLTLAPADKLPPTPHWQLLSFDTFAHAAFFAVQALLAWLWLRHQTRYPRLARHAGLTVLLGGTAFGALIEVLQMTLPFNRHGEWSDLISDSLGTAAALGLLKLAAGPLRRHGWALALLAGLITLSPAAAQDMPRVRATIKKLTSPKLHGRGYVKQGERKAADYLRGRLRQLKLEPLAPDYTQPFTLDVNTFPGQFKLGFINTYSRILRPGIDFIAAPESAAIPEMWSHPFELDTLVFSDTSAVRKMVQPSSLMGRLNSTKVIPAKLPKGKQVASLLIRAQDEARIPSLSPEAQTFLNQFQLRLVLQPKLTASIASFQSSVARLLISQAAWPAGFRYPGGVDPFIRITVDAQLQRSNPTQNLCAVVRGTAQPDSFLVVTAHYDHLGGMGRDTYFPGANDNASGVALLLELAAHYARPENRPACSIAFLLFGAEEAGLLGSRHFVQHPLVPLKQIKFLVNLDLLGTGEEGATVVNGRVHEVAFRQLLQLNEAGRYLPGLAARGRAANSDHFPFSGAGVPAFFLYTRGGSKAYHDVHDTPDKLSLAGFAGAYQLMRSFLDARSK